MDCSLCQLQFSSQKELQEHSWSLLHHRKIFRQKGRTVKHNCNLCDEDIENFYLYTKHINSDKHRSLITKYRQLHSDSAPPDDNSASNSASVVDVGTTKDIVDSESHILNPSNNSNSSTNQDKQFQKSKSHYDRYHYHKQNDVQPNIALPKMYSQEKRNVTNKHQEIPQKITRKNHSGIRLESPQRMIRKKCNETQKTTSVLPPYFEDNQSRHTALKRQLENSSAQFPSFAASYVNAASDSSTVYTTSTANLSSGLFSTSSPRSTPSIQSSNSRKHILPRHKNALGTGKRKRKGTPNRIIKDSSILGEELSSLEELSTKDFTKENPALSLLNFISSSEDDFFPPFISRKTNAQKDLPSSKATKENNNAKQFSSNLNKPMKQTVPQLTNDDNYTSPSSEITTNDIPRVDQNFTDENNTLSSIADKPTNDKPTNDMPTKDVSKAKSRIPGSNIQVLLKKMKPFEVTLEKLGRKKKAQSLSETGQKHKETEIQHRNGHASTEEQESTQETIFAAKPLTECSGPVKEIPANSHRCEFKKADTGTCDTVTAEKFCEYHKRVMKAVEMYVSTKVADGQAEVKDAVSLIESPGKQPSTKLISDDTVSFQTESYDLAANKTDKTKSVELLNGEEARKDFVVENRRKRLLSETTSDQEQGSAAESRTATGNIDFSRFKRMRNDNHRPRSNSSCFSSDNSDSAPNTNAITLRRFKYFNNFLSANHELHMNNLPPTVRKLIERKSKSNKTDEQRKSFSESENELPPQPPVRSSSDVNPEVQNTNTTSTIDARKNIDTMKTRGSEKVPGSLNESLSSTGLIASVTTVPRDNITLFNIQAPTKRKTGTTTTVANSRAIENVAMETNQQSRKKTVNTAQKKSYGNENPASTSEILKLVENNFDIPFPIINDRSSTPAINEVVNASLTTSSSGVGNFINSLPTLNISNISSHAIPSGPSDKMQQNSPIKTSEDFASPTTMLFNVNIGLFQRHLPTNNENSSTGEIVKIGENNKGAKDKNKKNDSLKNRQSATDPEVTSSVSKNDHLELFNIENNVVAPEVDSHMLDEVNSQQSMQTKMASNDVILSSSDTQRKHNREKVRSKRKRKEYEGIAGMQKQLRCLHTEENQVLNKLANANVILESLKQKMISVQDTIRTYTDRLCKMTEKKNKLVSKMAATANKSLDLEEFHVASQPNKGVAHDVSNASEYITPPRSPLGSRNSLMINPMLDDETSVNDSHITASYKPIRNSEKVKATKILSKIKPEIACVKIYEDYVFVSCGKPDYSTIAKKKKKKEERLGLPVGVKNSIVGIIEVLELQNGGKILCTASNKSIVIFYEFGSWRVIKHWRLESGPITQVHFNFNRLFVSTQRGIVKCIEPSKDQDWHCPVVKTFKRLFGKKASVSGMCSAIYKGRMQIWMVTKGGMIFVHTMDGEVVGGISMNGDNPPSEKSRVLKIQILEEKLYVLGKPNTLNVYSMEGQLLEMIRLSSSFSFKNESYFVFREHMIVASNKPPMNLFVHDIKEGKNKKLEREVISTSKKHEKIKCIDYNMNSIVMATVCGDVFVFDL